MNLYKASHVYKINAGQYSIYIAINRHSIRIFLVHLVYHELKDFSSS